MADFSYSPLCTENPLETKLKSLWKKLQCMVCNSLFPKEAMCIITFILGFVFSPWSWGLAWVIGFLLIYEVFFACVSEMKSPHWDLEYRVALIMIYLLGWILGRIFIGYQNPL